MALGGSGAYYSATNIPEATYALNAVYTRHIWVRNTSLPSTSSTNIACAMRGAFNAAWSHDELAWNHTSASFNRSNYHRSSTYVAGQMSSGSFAVDTWISIGATFDGTNVRSYVNGSLDGTSGNSTAASVGNTQICLNGSSNYNTTPSALFTNGQSAELAIWDVVLNASELAALAKGFRATRIRPSRLVFYAPVIRGKQDIRGGRTLTLGAGSETVTSHPRIF